MTEKYVIGIDFGTVSCRALLVNTVTGEEIAIASYSYEHGVMDQTLPDGTPLETDWALQHPNDYIDCLAKTVQTVLAEADVQKEDVIGLGIDFTSSTILPLDEKGDPLCLKSSLASRPHSYVKLWKHHAAQKEADEITRLAEIRGESFLARYGGRISSEWVLPKILQVLKEDPDIYYQADLFMEAGDWLVYKLTGNLVRSSNTVGYKSFWNKHEGYPDNAFFKAIHPEMGNILSTKLRGQVKTIGDKAGELTSEMAELIGLHPGTSIAVSIIDAHAAVPAVGAVRPGQLVMTIGTSTCHLLLADEERFVQGVCGMVQDGIIPGYVSYEAGQVAVGDSFAWYVENCVPAEVTQAAKEKGVSIHTYLENKAAKLKPGQSGLIALDWWNGNRSILDDSDLSGAIIGLTLLTKPEEIYRTLIESTAFGTRKIIENYRDAGLNVSEIFVCGGIPQKNQLLLQIFADVLNREIRVADSNQVTALGSAIFAATAAGAEKGGYDTIFDAVEKLAKVKKETIIPNRDNVERYNQLYEIYQKLHNYLGTEHADLMHQLKQMKTEFIYI